jgi:hypothetical protein
VGPCIEDGIPIEVRHLSEPLTAPAKTTIGPDLIADQGPLAAACTMDVCTIEATFLPLGTPGAQQATLLALLAERGLGVHASSTWVDGTRLIVDANAAEAVQQSLVDAGMQMTQTGTPSAMITFIGSWEDPEAWLNRLEFNGAEAVDYDTRKVRILVPRGHAKDTLEHMATEAAWITNA